MWLCLLVTTAAAATVPGTVITNQAQVNYVASSTSFSVASNVVTVTVLGQTNHAELSVAGDYPISNPGDTLNLSARLTNAGSNTLRNGQLSFKVPLDATVTPGGGVSMRLDGGTVTATVPDLAVGTSTTLRFGLVLPTTATPGTAAVNFNYDANGTAIAAGEYALVVQAHTNSQAAFMVIDVDGGTSLPVPITQYKTGTGDFADIPAPPVSKDSAQLVTDAPLSLMVSSSYHKNETMFLWVNDPDKNRNPAAADAVTINFDVINDAGVVIDNEVIQANETGANTGQFIGYIVEREGIPITHDGHLSVTTNSRVHATYMDSSDAHDTFGASVLIDPYGIVFNSRTGQPIDGATVSMINRDTGLPASVFGDDGVSRYPATLLSGATASDASGQTYDMPPGGFRFPMAPPGNYQLVVSLPDGSGYVWPSRVATSTLQTLPRAPFAIDVGSRGETFVLEAGPALHLDIPLDPLGAGLFVTKTVNKPQAAVGDFLHYSLAVKVASSLTPVDGVRVTDVLPHGFKYRKGSMTVNDAAAADPIIASDGRTLSIPVGDLAAAASVNVGYVVQVAAAQEGEAENRASASGVFGETSNTAVARVMVREDLMHSRSLILGQVTAPSTDGTQHGVPGIRIYLEDGTYAVTDDKGMYHFEGIRPGTHVVQLDVATLPLKYDVAPPENNRFAGRGWSQFVDIQGGTMWRADFELTLKEKATGIAAVELESLLDLDQKSLFYKATLHSTRVPLRNVRLTVLLPNGVRYVAGSSLLNGEAAPEPTVMDDMLVYRLGDQAPDWNALLQFSTQVDGAVADGDRVTKALLTVDTPEQKNARTPPVEVALRSHNVEGGHDSKHYVMRWQFGAMEAGLNEEAKRQLDGLIQQLAGFKNLRIRVTGYSDNRPIRARSHSSFKDNLALSAARAEAAARYLRDALDLASDAIVVSGAGEKDPLADNATAEGRALNRRVEIEIDAEQSTRKDLLVDGQRQRAGEEIKIVGLLPGETWPQKPAVVEKSEPTPQFDDQWLETAAPGIEWLLPAPGYLPSAPFVHVGIKHDPRQKVAVSINGAPVDKVHFESTHINAAHTVAYSWWRGVGLKDGDNAIEIVVTDADGAVVKRMQRVVHYSRAPIKAELVGAQSIVTADGITSPVIAVRFTDRDGYPAREGTSGEFVVAPPYAADTRLPEGYAVMAGAPADKPRYMVGKDGVALIKLQPTTQAGEVMLTLPLMNGDHEIKTALKPVLRDWILVGFADGTVGYNTLKGNIQPLGGKAGEDDIYQDGRVALYAKGRVSGDWLVTFAYDTNKKKNNNQLSQTVDPGTYYTVYGDNGTQRYDAASAAKLYLKIERETFYALFGDYDTELRNTKLFTYSRGLTGLKSRYRDDRYEVVVFASESNQGFIKDEIRGQGVSIPYRLSHKTIVINSEKVRIQTRDRFRSEVIVSEKTLSQHVDYDIDYVEGVLSFREPILSVDSNLNPVFIVVDYESYDGQNFSMTYGGRGQVKVDGKTELGVTHVNEGRVGGEARLDAVDGTYQINETTQARVEIAHSRSRDSTVNNTGNAYLAQIDHRAPLADMKVYVSQYDAGFGVGQYNGSENATRKIGAEGVYHANRRTDVKGQAYHQDNLATDASRDVAEAETRYRAGNNTELHLGLQTAQDRLGNDQTQSSTLLTTGVNQKFFDQKLTVRADRDQALGEAESVDFPSRTRLGLDYLITEKTQLFAEQEFTNGKERDTQTTVMGVKTVPWTDSEVFTTVSQKQDGASDNTSAGMGLRQRLALDDQWSMDASVEKSKTVNGSGVAPFNTNVPFASGGDTDFTASSLGLTYNPGDWLWNVRGEYRDAASGDQRNVQSSAQTSVRNDLGLLAAITLTDANLVSGHFFNGKVSLGLAYRPTASKWLVLDKLDYIRDLKEDTADPYDSRRWVNNLNANYRSNRRWQTSLQYGSKLVTDTLGGKTYDSYLDLTGLETRYDLDRNWDVGVHGSVLHAWRAHQVDYSYGASLGRSFATNMWISVGYNLRGFYDQDFSASHFTSQGPYLQVRMKFDQQSVKDVIRQLAQ